MKKLRIPYSKRFPPLRLYRDDVDQLLAIFERNGEQVAITAQKYELSSAAELDELKRRMVSHAITNFKVETSNHSCSHCPSSFEWLSLSLTKDIARLYVSDEADTQLMGIASQIGAFLMSKRSFLSYAGSLRASYIAYAILFMCNALSCASSLPQAVANLEYLWTHGFQGASLQFGNGLQALWGVLPIVLMLIVIPYGVWASYISGFRHCIVYLDERSARPGFIQRNWDQIVVGSICAVIGAVVGTLVTILLTALVR